MLPPIEPTDRLCLFGRTGSGKTTFARGLLTVARRAGNATVTLDPKHRYDDGSPIRKSFDPRKRDQTIRVPVRDGELAEWAAQLGAIYRGGPRIVYIDELTLVNPGRTVVPELGAIIRTGRELGLGCWIASQRPKDLPSAVFTEAEHFYVFQLQFDADREKVASFTSERILPYLERLRGHECVYYGVRDDTIVYLAPTLERIR